MPKQTRDFQAALSVLGQLAKASGHGLTLADYSRTSNVAKDKHVLIIGPSHMVKDHLTGAPQAFREAMSGLSSSGQNLLQAKFGQSAGLKNDKSALKYAAAQSGSFKISRGGVAALYGAGDGRLIGVISATPRTSFSVTSQNLIKPDHWKSLQGGVARWTASSIIMTQTAQSDIGIQKPEIKTQFEWPDFNLSFLENYDFYLPEFNWPEINWPEPDMPTVNLPEFIWPKFNIGQPRTQNKVELIDPVKSVENIVPRLKPIVKAGPSQAGSASTGLRGPFQYAENTPKHVGSFHGLKRNTQAKWRATQQWFNAKKTALIESRSLNEVTKTKENLGNQTKPASRTLKSVILDKLPAKGLVQIGERNVSIYGLILIFALSLVLLLMSLTSPKSRLGGRH